MSPHQHPHHAPCPGLLFHRLRIRKEASNVSRAGDKDDQHAKTTATMRDVGTPFLVLSPPTRGTSQPLVCPHCASQP